MAVSERKAVEFGYKYLNPEPSAWDGTKRTIGYLLAHDGINMNWELREGCLNPMCKKASDVISKNKTKTDIVVYRGVSNEVYKEMKKAAKKIRGTDYYEKGFLFASLVKGCELNTEIKMRIFIPKGQNAIFLGNANDELYVFYPIAIQCGSHLKIISCDSQYINCYLIGTEGFNLNL